MNKRICLIGENSKEYVKKIIEIWNDEDCAVLVDYRIPIETATNMIRESKVELCFIDYRLKPLWENYTETQVIFFNSSVEPVQEITKDIMDLYVPNYSEKEALILFSSGTTGRSKGIVLSYRAINTNADMIISYMNLNEKDVLFIVKVIVHSSTVIGELLVCLKTRTRLFIGAVNLSIRKLMRDMSEKKVTVLCVNPTILSLITEYLENNPNYDNSFSRIYCYSAALTESKHEKCSRLLPHCKVYCAYGLTEAGPRVTVQDDSSLVGSVGKPIGNVEIRILSENGDIQKNGVVGRIMVKTPSAYTKYTFENEKKEEWINTKDLGYVTDSGELYVVGRADDVIIKSGCNIFPNEIEQIVMNQKEIRDCYIFGYPDELYGQKIICFYVPNNIEGEDIELIRKLKVECMKNLLPYEIPDSFICVNNIDKNRNGKNDKQSNIKRYEEIKKYGRN